MSITNHEPDWTANMRIVQEIREKDPIFFSHLQNIADILRDSGGRYNDDHISKKSEGYTRKARFILIVRHFEGDSNGNYRLLQTERSSNYTRKDFYDASWILQNPLIDGGYSCLNQLYISPKGDVHVTRTSFGANIGEKEFSHLRLGKEVIVRCHEFEGWVGYEELKIIALPLEVFISFSRPKTNRRGCELL